MTTTSTISLPAARVVDMCEAYMKARDEYIAARREPLIQKAMKPKLFGLIKAKTREQAIESLENSSLFDEYNMMSLEGSAAYTIKELWAAAKLAIECGQSTVRVSATAAYALQWNLFSR